MEEKLHFQDNRLSPTHLNESILEQLIFQLIAGYDADASANILRHDPFFQEMLEKMYQPHSLRFRVSGIASVTVPMHLYNFKRSIKRCWIRYRIQRNATEMVLDLDFTYCDTYGD